MSISSATSCTTRRCVSRRSARERSDALARNGVEPGAYLVLTLHREANLTAERLAQVGEALAELDEAVVFPAHPRTSAALAATSVEFPP